VRAAAGMLEGLGHHVEVAWPDALADQGASTNFGTLWATQMAMARSQFADMLGRDLTPDDLEPVNWAQAEMAERFSAIDLATAQAAMYTFRRRMQQWWADGWDLLLTPTVAEPPPLLSVFAPDPDDALAQARRAWQFVPFTPPYNMTGQPAISVPLHWNDDGLPLGVQLVAAYGREDVLIRVAAQLEAAHPWADRHPKLA
jgi:amidase